MQSDVVNLLSDRLSVRVSHTAGVLVVVEILYESEMSHSCFRLSPASLEVLFENGDKISAIAKYVEKNAGEAEKWRYIAAKYQLQPDKCVNIYFSFARGVVICLERYEIKANECAPNGVSLPLEEWQLLMQERTSITETVTTFIGNLGPSLSPMTGLESAAAKYAPQYRWLSVSKHGDELNEGYFWGYDRPACYKEGSDLRDPGSTVHILERYTELPTPDHVRNVVFFDQYLELGMNTAQFS